MKLTSTQRFGKVQFDLVFELPMAAEAEETMKPLMVAALEGLKTDVAAKAKKQFAEGIGIKPAKYETDMMDDIIEAEKVFKPLFAAKNIVASNFRDWTPGVNGAALTAIEKLVAKMANDPKYCDGKTPAEILAGLS